MKKIFSHPEPTENQAGPTYWRSLDEVANTPGFQEYLEREFPEGASVIDGVDRRHFLKIMAASFALAGVGLSGCRRPERNILPYAKQPEQQIPGKPVFYATAMPLRQHALPLLAETHEGRPTKIEGNPTYTRSNGKSDLQAQASILDLYDPDRATRHLSDGEAIERENVFKLLDGIAQKFQGNGGAGLAFLAEQSSSPTRRALVDGLKRRFPQAIWADYEPIDEAAVDRAASALLDQPARPFYHPGKASRILSLESDIVNASNGNLYYAQSFAKGRRLAKPEEGMNRLYAVESELTVTGGMADHRLRLSSTFLPSFIARLAAEVLEGLGNAPALVQPLRDAAAGLEESEAWTDHHAADWIRECAHDLVENKGKSLIVAGAHLPEEVQALVLGLNIALGNVGNTVEFLQIDPPQAKTINELAAAIDQGEVQSLFVLGGNPVYNAPADLDWASLQQKVDEVVRYGYYVDETSEHADHHIAATHYLESWGDARTTEGLVLAIQPMIQPLFGGINELEVLAVFSDQEEREAYVLVQKTIAELAGAGEKIFRKFLHDGLLENSEYPRVTATFTPALLQGFVGRLNLSPVAPTAENLEVRFVRDNLVDDGRFANNGWLQECPDPVTKLTWDNAITISPRLAGELGVLGPASTVQVARKNPNPVELGKQLAHVVKLTVDGRTIQGPVHVQAGLANYSVILPLGYGRTGSGRIGNQAGFNAYALRSSANPFVASGAKIEVVTGEVFRLANTQEHWSMEGRAIVREANLETYQNDPAFAAHMGVESHAPPNLGEKKGMPLREQVLERPPGMSLYEHPDKTGVNQWGMVLDLNTCTGCSACVVACQAENNIPIVGKEQVLRGREMHWIRLDRYFATGEADNRAVPEDPQMVTQPMLCQHCDNAPCEVVCPVAATVQDDEGLNVMVYNRCIGTRYCANNCPYKVRRFNFFDWNKRELDKLYQGPLGPRGVPETKKMQMNPDVTVRMRGVMEKCTFCVQRITEAKVEQKVKAGATDEVMVEEGAFQVACQQACPTESIVFGNILNPDSEVTRLKQDDRNYSVLGYLNTRPRTTYLAKVRNPNVRMPDYTSQPLTTVEYKRQNYGDTKGHGASNGHGAGDGHGKANGHGETHSNGGQH